MKPLINTKVPDYSSIELISYYDEFLSYYPDCEPETKKWFVHAVRPDWILLDCGANIGYYSILFARLAPRGSIYAFEPTITYDMLIDNLNHNHIENVIPVRLALGKESGKRIDGIFRIWGNDPEYKEYDFITIDDFVSRERLDRVDCIKIDVDSFDFEVLLGAKKTLMGMDPYVVVELNHALSRRNQSAAQTLEWLAGFGYKTAKVFDYDNYLLKRNEAPSLALPKERRITLVFPAASTETE